MKLYETKRTRYPVKKAFQYPTLVRWGGLCAKVDQTKKAVEVQRFPLQRSQCIETEAVYTLEQDDLDAVAGDHTLPTMSELRR